MNKEDQEEICRKIYSCRVKPRDKNSPEYKAERRYRIKLALICMVIASCTCLPIVMPVLLMSKFHLALAVGGGIMTVILLLAGYVIGKSIGRDGYIVGLMMVILIGMLSLIATFTGG